MARPQSMAKLGTFPLVPEYRTPLAKLIAPQNQPFRVLDPFCDTAEAIHEMAGMWGNAHIFGVEIKEEAARQAQDRLGVNRVHFEDAYRMHMTNNGFSVIYLNPPYQENRYLREDEFKTEAQRTEAQALRHFTKYLQWSGIMIWVAYKQHVTRYVARYFFKNYAAVFPFYLGKHLDAYDQVAIVAVKHMDTDAFASEDVIAQNTEVLVEAAEQAESKFRPVEKGFPRKKGSRYMRILVDDEGKRYPDWRLVPPVGVKMGAKDQFRFNSPHFDQEREEKINERFGAHLTEEFKRIAQPPTPPDPIQPTHRANNGQLAVLLASGVMNGIELSQNGKPLAVRGTIRPSREEINVEESEDEKGNPVKEETYHTIQKPQIITAQDGGEISILQDDEEIVGFIEEHLDALKAYYEKTYKPAFDNRIEPDWGEIFDNHMIAGSHTPKDPQEQVVAAVTEHLSRKRYGIIVGEPSVGKTGMSGYVILALRRIAEAKQIIIDGWRSGKHTEEEYNRAKDLMNSLAKRYNCSWRDLKGLKPGKVVVVTAPVNLPKKWATNIEKQGNGKIYTAIVATPQEYNEVVEYAKMRPDMIVVAVITYTRLKLGESTEAAYNIHKGTDGFVRTYETKDGQTIEKIASRRWVVCPTTGTVLKEYKKGGFLPVKEKFVAGANRLRFLEQNYHHDWELSDPSDADKAKIRQEYGSGYPIPQSILRPRKKKATSGNGFALWTTARDKRTRPKGDTNGRVKFKEEKVEVPARQTRVPHYEIRSRGHGDDYKMTINVTWREYERRPFTLNRKVITQNLVPDIPIQDKWLATQGIMPFIKTAKRKRVDDYMKKHQLRVYSIGEGHPFLDKWLKRLDIDTYYLEAGDKQFRQPRYPLADYIKRKHPNSVGLFIVDEIHNGKANNTDIGKVIRTMCHISDMSLGLTGTLYGGFSSSVYSILHTFNRRARKRFPWVRGTPTHWIKVMGGTKDVYVTKPKYEKNGTMNGTNRYYSVRDKEIAAASPELLGIMVESCFFISLRDLGDEMVPFEEIPVPVEMDDAQHALYQQAYRKSHDYLKNCILGGDGSYTGSHYQNMLRLPDSMHRVNEVHHNKNLEPWKRKGRKAHRKVFEIPPLYDDESFNPKEKAIAEKVKEHLDKNERVIIYISQTGTRDIQPRWEHVINTLVNGAKVKSLRSSVDPADRMEWVEREVSAGLNVMICNPNLVREGVDLVDFNVIMYVEIDASLIVMSQSSRRIWRLNQPKDRCYVYYFYWSDDKYQRLATVSIADKTVAANTLYGAEGGSLAAMSETTDLWDNLKNAVEEGFRLSDEEVQERFKVAKYKTEDYLRSVWYAEPRKKKKEFQDIEGEEEYNVEMAMLI